MASSTSRPRLFYCAGQSSSQMSESSSMTSSGGFCSWCRLTRSSVVRTRPTDSVCRWAWIVEDGICEEAEACADEEGKDKSVHLSEITDASRSKTHRNPRSGLVSSGGGVVLVRERERFPSSVRKLPPRTTRCSPSGVSQGVSHHSQTLPVISKRP